MSKPTVIDGLNVVVSGRLPRIARLQDEYFAHTAAPGEFAGHLRAAGVRADAFTFIQEIHDRAPHHSHLLEWDQVAVLPITTYEHWLNEQINFKPRNKLRKALKSGLELRTVEFSDELLRAIMGVYDENPVRQGRKAWHYGKDFATIKREHSTFLDRSEFIGCYFKGEMIGFVKVVHGPHYSVYMNIMSMICHRDKAPTNALLARTIESCARRNIPYLKYGVWGRRGLNDFKVQNGFQCFQIPRYYVPLTLRGRMALQLRLHRKLVDLLPEAVINRAANLRARWSEFRYRKPTPPEGAPAAMTPERGKA
jgi:hypothetical protein